MFSHGFLRQVASKASGLGLGGPRTALFTIPGFPDAVLCVGLAPQLESLTSLVVVDYHTVLRAGLWCVKVLSSLYC